jgi:hypothetical protein
MCWECVGSSCVAVRTGVEDTLRLIEVSIWILCKVEWDMLSGLPGTWSHLPWYSLLKKESIKPSLPYADKPAAKSEWSRPSYHRLGPPSGVGLANKTLCDLPLSTLPTTCSWLLFWGFLAAECEAKIITRENVWLRVRPHDFCCSLITSKRDLGVELWLVACPACIDDFLVVVSKTI